MTVQAIVSFLSTLVEPPIGNTRVTKLIRYEEDKPIEQISYDVANNVQEYSGPNNVKFNNDNSTLKISSPCNMTISYNRIYGTETEVKTGDITSIYRFKDFKNSELIQYSEKDKNGNIKKYEPENGKLIETITQDKDGNKVIKTYNPRNGNPIETVIEFKENDKLVSHRYRADGTLQTKKRYCNPPQLLKYSTSKEVSSRAKEKRPLFYYENYAEDGKTLISYRCMGRDETIETLNNQKILAETESNTKNGQELITN